MTQAPVAVRELLIHGLRNMTDPVSGVHDTTYPVFTRHMYCPFTWRV